PRHGNCGAGLGSLGWSVASSIAGSHGPHSDGCGCPDAASATGEIAIELTPKMPPNVAGTWRAGNFTRTWYDGMTGLIGGDVEMHVSLASVSAITANGVESVQPAQSIDPMLALT